MALVRKVIKDYGTISMSASNQPQASQIVPNYGDLVGIDIENTVAVTIGTGTIATGDANLGINDLLFRDKSRQTIHDFSSTSKDIKYLRFLNSLLVGRFKGVYTAPSNMTSTGGSANLVVPTQINSGEHPLSVDLTLGTLSNILSTVGTATATIRVQLWGIWNVPSVNAKGQATQPTLRSQIVAYTNSATGNVTIDFTPYQGTLVVAIGLLDDATTPADADFTSLQFSPDGSLSYDAVVTQSFVDEDNLVTLSGHVAGLIAVTPIPFFASSKTKFIPNMATGNNLRLYILKRSV